MKNLLKRLNEPFPENNSFLEDFRFIVGAGIFVTLFLYLLRPFGFHEYPENPFWICAFFGFITILTATTYELFCAYILKLKKDVPTWTLGKWILFILGLITVIGISNYLFLVYMSWVSIDLEAFLHIFGSTLFIGVFPIVLSGLLIQMNAYKRNEHQAENLQTNLVPIATKVHTIVLPSADKKQQELFRLHDLFYIEAMKNYVLVCYLKEGIVEKITFRNTIKRMEMQMKGSSLIRCHRSFIVNINLIEKVAGNAQGLRLTLKDLPDFEVPVSRKYIPTLKQLIS